MRVSRAGFLRTCGAAVLASGLDPLSCLAASDVLPAPVTEAAIPSGRFRLEDASAAAFRPYLKTTMAVSREDGTRVPLRLVRVTEGPAHGTFEQFSVMFDAPASTALPQGTYAVQHPSLGAFDLFIVPVGGSKARRAEYEACFSRRVNRGD